MKNYKDHPLTQPEITATTEWLEEEMSRLLDAYAEASPGERVYIGMDVRKLQAELWRRAYVAR